MAHDDELAHRVRALLADDEAVTEKRMFGGLAFLVHGHMAVAASGQGGLLVRVDPDASAALQARDGVSPMVMRGRPMQGWLRVEAEQVRTARSLRPWVERGVAVARSLPPKGGKG